jgi:hypothetical protein
MQHWLRKQITDHWKWNLGCMYCIVWVLIHATGLLCLNLASINSWVIGVLGSIIAALILGYLQDIRNNRRKVISLLYNTTTISCDFSLEAYNTISRPQLSSSIISDRRLSHWIANERELENIIGDLFAIYRDGHLSPNTQLAFETPDNTLIGGRSIKEHFEILDNRINYKDDKIGIIDCVLESKRIAVRIQDCLDNWVSKRTKLPKLKDSNYTYVKPTLIKQGFFVYENGFELDDESEFIDYRWNLLRMELNMKCIQKIMEKF